MCQGSHHFSGFLHNFVFAKVATSSIRVNFNPVICRSSFNSQLCTYERGLSAGSPWHHYTLGRINSHSQDLETGCPKLAVVKLLGIEFFK